MSHRASVIAVVSALAIVAALGSLFVSSRANAGGRGYGPGMMGGQWRHDHGPGMPGGVYRHTSGMMSGYYGRVRGSTPSASATLRIRHQYAHCHAWSLNGGPFKAHQSLSLTVGETLAVINMDVMPHRLVKLAGPPVTMHNGTTTGMMGGYGSGTPGLMNHMGASTRVKFSTAGVYHFRTHAGHDYMPGIQTSGADHVLTLSVTIH